MKLKTAFTMAEALITLTIVGVIAVITIPTVKDFSDVSKMVASAKKAYSAAQSATTAVEIKYGDAKFWPWTDTALINSRFREVMEGAPVVNTYTTSLFDGSDAWSTVNGSWFQTNDGMTWYVYNYSNAQGAYGVIHVDTNGPARPNRLGYDVIGFVITKDGVHPLNDGLHDNNSTWGCVNYMIKYGKMPWMTDTNFSSCSTLPN